MYSIFISSSVIIAGVFPLLPGEAHRIDKETSMDQIPFTAKSKKSFIYSILAMTLCLFSCACDASTGPNWTFFGTNDSTSNSGSTTIGQGTQGVQVFVEPTAGESVITSAIDEAKQSVWLEIYLLTDTNIIRALENAAHRGLDVRVMLEQHPYGMGSASPRKTLDKLSAAGIKAQPTSSSFSLTHEKGIPFSRNVSA